MYSGLVGQNKVHEFSTKKDTICSFCDVKPSKIIHESKHEFSKKLPNLILIFCQHGPPTRVRLMNLAIMLLLHYINQNMQIIREC